MSTRIYVVSSKSNIASDKGHRLVKAATPAQALRHVASGLFEVEVASQDALVKLAGSGIQVEVAGEQPGADGQPQE